MGLDNPLHIALIVVLLLLLFGAKRLPEIGRSLGTGMREFKQSISGDGHDPANAQRQSQQQSQPTLPPVPAQAPAQTPAQTAAASSAQDAFAQRGPTSGE